jgi:hypothetical protein
MPDGDLGDDDHLVLDAAGERAIDEKVRVEVALPVVPQLRRIGLERRHGNAGALERLGRLAVVVRVGQLMNWKTSRGIPRSVRITRIARFTGASEPRP